MTGYAVDPEWNAGKNGSPLPEHRLLVAIVRRAVWDFVLYKNASPTEQRNLYQLAVDAAGWIFWDGEEEVDSEGRYSFLYICNYLGLDVARVRRVVTTLNRQDIKRLNNYIKES